MDWHIAQLFEAKAKGSSPCASLQINFQYPSCRIQSDRMQNALPHCFVVELKANLRRHCPIVAPEIGMLKIIGWIVGIVFVIGLLVVFGIFDLIF